MPRPCACSALFDAAHCASHAMSAALEQGAAGSSARRTRAFPARELRNRTRSRTRRSRGCRRPRSSATSWCLLGAMYLDSNGDIEAVRGVLERLGLLFVLCRVVHEGVDVRHPVSRDMEWTGKRGI
ncbi:hypothetical protein DFH11DRAFT_1608078 [Phellopilus nigrolimitatus]|nr:hypothetical protein DFH11DRAFT_1608078 [Phellopilus nigrolimitatus]